MIKTSVILTTYNWPEALSLVLNSLNRQSILPDEVIVADDGSTESTAKLISEWHNKVSFSLKHVWQEDRGFRAAKIRNMAVANASGDYCIFLDGDCIVRPDFVAQHLRLAEIGFFVVGNRVLLSDKMTRTLFQQSNNITHCSLLGWFLKRCKGDINRWLSLWNLPGNSWRKLKPSEWRGAKTCNLGVWRENFYHVNGFDESFQGWGYEDSDLVIRLIQFGIKRKSGKYATTVLHMGHEKIDRDREKINLTLLEETVKGARQVFATDGVNKYL
jgi:glycosyltransferase involved in cell wall biosynthesis